MIRKLEYSINKWEKEKKKLRKNIEENINYVIRDLSDCLKNLNNPERDVIYEYNTLAFEYYCIANNFYFSVEDIESFKGYYYLSAKAIEMCYVLYKKGIHSRFDRENENIKSNLSGRTQADCALLAGNVELALSLATQNSVLGNMILQNYEEARKYLEIETENDKNYIEMLLSIIDGDEKRLKESLQQRIIILRKEAKYELTNIDRFGLTILKLAKMRGMSCDIHVAELPLVLLEDTPIDYKKWRLPIPEHVKKILDE